MAGKRVLDSSLCQGPIFDSWKRIRLLTFVIIFGGFYIRNFSQNASQKLFMAVWWVLTMLPKLLMITIICAELFSPFGKHYWNSTTVSRYVYLVEVIGAVTTLFSLTWLAFSMKNIVNTMSQTVKVNIELEQLLRAGQIKCIFCTFAISCVYILIHSFTLIGFESNHSDLIIALTFISWVFSMVYNNILLCMLTSLTLMLSQFLSYLCESYRSQLESSPPTSDIIERFRRQYEEHVLLVSHVDDVLHFPIAIFLLQNLICACFLVYLVVKNFGDCPFCEVSFIEPIYMNLSSLVLHATRILALCIMCGHVKKHVSRLSLSVHSIMIITVQLNGYQYESTSYIKNIS